MRAACSSRKLESSAGALADLQPQPHTPPGSSQPISRPANPSYLTSYSRERRQERTVGLRGVCAWKLPSHLKLSRCPVSQHFPPSCDSTVALLFSLLLIRLVVLCAKPFPVSTLSVHLPPLPLDTTYARRPRDSEPRTGRGCTMTTC